MTDRSRPENPAINEIKLLSILIPVFNEVRTLEPLIEKVISAPLPCDREIILVDDGSTDGSRELAQELSQKYHSLRVFCHKKNRGKGAALRTAIKKMRGDWAIMQDADLEYDPMDWQAMIVPIQMGIADAVYGSRFLSANYRRALYFWHTLANKTLTLVSNVLNNLNLTDMETCYKLIRGDILKSLKLRSNGFDIEPEITAKLARWGARIYEVPVSYRGRSYAEGKKIHFRDAFQAFWAMIRYCYFDRDYTNHDGFLILQAVRRAKKFNHWLMNQFKEYTGNEVVEAGCGIGNLTELLLDKKRLVCLDYEEFYVKRIKESYGHLSNISVSTADLTQEDHIRTATKGKPVDSIVCINVLEHIEPDVLVLENFYKNLKPGGHAIILVPHNPDMYTEVDRLLGHYRRYTKKELADKLQQAGFEVVKTSGFNRVGGFGWWFSGKILKKKTLSPGQMTVFEMLMPLIRILEHIPFHPHNSVIAIGKKPDDR